MTESALLEILAKEMYGKSYENLVHKNHKEVHREEVLKFLQALRTIPAEELVEVGIMPMSTEINGDCIVTATEIDLKWKELPK